MIHNRTYYYEENEFTFLIRQNDPHETELV